MNLRLIIASVLLTVSSGYRHYQDRIPNGDQVPHPCKPNFIWRGVGHQNVLGGGDRNPFGLDFAEYHEWTKELCQKDSDGDGMTNGQELGDPDCVWTPLSGQFPDRVRNITHPGVCDPWGSPQCEEKNKFVTCDDGELKCDAINDPSVRNITLRFPKGSKVPPEETSYMCMSYELDLDPNQDFHLIATKPLIDNPNVMHHIVVQGCSNTATFLDKPKLCYMAQEGCGSVLGLWTLGMPGECLYREAGIKIGGSGIQKVMMQFHWTNPERRVDYEDSSGMILYYTTQLRKYDAGVMTVGQMHMNIPPGQPKVTATSTCSSDYTREVIPHGIYLTTGLNHMHYLGYQQNVELFHEDAKVRDLTPDEVYSYDNPVVHVYDPPQRVLPGDRLETTCVYRSLSRTRTTFWGEGTYDEMCYGIFTYFPIENMTIPACITYDDVNTIIPEAHHLGDCDIAAFSNTSHPDTMALRRLVLDNCDFTGKCRQECPAAIAKATQDPCLSSKYGEYLLFTLKTFSHKMDDIKFLAALASCDCPLSTQNKKNDGDLDVLNSGHSAFVSTIVLGLSILYHLA